MVNDINISIEDLADIIREAVNNNNDVDGVYWKAVAKEVIEALKGE